MADMRYRRLGESGLAVSVVGLGCNNFGRRIGPEKVREVVDAAIEAGVTLFDTADTYGTPHGASEEQLGAALKANGRRNDVVIATKFGSPMEGVNGPDWNARGGRRYIQLAVDSSLRRLGTDWIDLYQMHAPDRRTPIEETLAALDEVVRAGKVRYIGSSNFAGWQVANSAWISRTQRLTPFISAQNHYSWLERAVETDLVPACTQFGVGLLPYFPLASGLLTGKYKRDTEAPQGTRLSYGPFAGALASARWDVIEALEAFAEARSLTILDVAIGGLAAKPAIGSVIAGATSGDQVRANVAAGAWVPSPDELAQLDKITAKN
jgi:aryl-alcohol dehydrogenase-like predicted oxidoreductase